MSGVKLEHRPGIPSLSDPVNELYLLEECGGARKMTLRIAETISAVAEIILRVAETTSCVAETLSAIATVTEVVSARPYFMEGSGRPLTQADLACRLNRNAAFDMG